MEADGTNGIPAGPPDHWTLHMSITIDDTHNPPLGNAGKTGQVYAVVSWPGG